jgi:hypothetical protein
MVDGHWNKVESKGEQWDEYGRRTTFSIHIVNVTWLEVIRNHVICGTVFTQEKVTVFSYARVNVGRHYSDLYVFFEKPALLLLLLLLLLRPLSLSEGRVGILLVDIKCIVFFFVALAFTRALLACECSC